MAFTKLERKKIANVTIWGRQGTGKTVNAVIAASLLHRSCGGKVGVFDTENALGSMVDGLESMGLAEHILHWRSGIDAKKPVSSDFLDFLDECKKAGTSIIVVDSVTDMLKGPRLQWQERSGQHRIPLAAYAEIDFPFKRAIEHLKRLDMHAIYTVREKVESITNASKDESNAEPDVKDFEYLSDIKCHTMAHKHSTHGKVFSMEVTSRMAKGVKMYSPPGPQAWSEILAPFLTQ